MAIWALSDLTADERSVLAQAAREEASVSDKPERWEAIATAIEGGGKQPHSIEPGGYRALPQPTQPEIYLPGTQPGPPRHVVLGEGTGDAEEQRS